jgi:hypothetical protein
MMARAQIALEREFHRRARKRAGELGVSFAEYVRRLVERDLSHPQTVAGVESLFDLGSSGGSDIAKHKHAMIEEAVDFEATTSLQRKTRRDHRQANG